MVWASHLCQKAKRLWSCERGAVAPLVGVCIIMLIGSVAVAVDIGRGQVAQSKLQAALDAAGLAAGAIVGQTLTVEDLTPEAEKYLNANFNGGTVDATITDFELELSDDQMIVTLEAHASLPTTFMRIFGRNIMNVAARSEITREMTGLEVAVVLDVTGSMCTPDCTKRDGMKVAATDLMDILFGDNATVDDLWVGIVPFSQSVNIGTSRTSWLTDYAARSAQDNCIGPTSGTPKCTAPVASTANVSTRTNPVTLVDDWMFSSKAGWYFAPHGWGGCVRERYATGRDVTDDPPATEGFLTYFVPDTNASGNNNWRGPTSSGSGSGNYRVTATRSANRNCPPSPITPLTNVKATLTTAIAALDVDGYTHINVGAVWGWRLLSPEWNGVWGGGMDTNDLPLDYDEELSQKALVLMTDGNNDMPASSDPTMTAYGFLSEGNLGTTTNDTAAELVLDGKLTAVCNSMKANGVTIYTVSFGAGVEPESVALLQDCASVADYYFHAATSADLSTAFHIIGDSLSKLRVSQ